MKCIHIRSHTFTSNPNACMKLEGPTKDSLQNIHSTIFVPSKPYFWFVPSLFPYYHSYWYFFFFHFIKQDPLSGTLFQRTAAHCARRPLNRMLLNSLDFCVERKRKNIREEKKKKNKIVYIQCCNRKAKKGRIGMLTMVLPLFRSFSIQKEPEIHSYNSLSLLSSSSVLFFFYSLHSLIIIESAITVSP